MEWVGFAGVVGWIGFGVVAALAAQARGRPFGAWLLLGVLFGLYALLAVLVMRPVTAPGPGARPAEPPLPTVGVRRQAEDGDGALVEVYRGMHIKRSGDRLAIGPREFDNREAAVAWVDSRYG